MREEANKKALDELDTRQTQKLQESNPVYNNLCTKTSRRRSRRKPTPQNVRAYDQRFLQRLSTPR